MTPVALAMAALALQYRVGDVLTPFSAIKALFFDGQVNRFLQSAPTLRVAGPAFFLHTLVWAFAPWFPALAVFAVAHLASLRHAWRTQLALTPAPRLVFYASAALTFIALSMTRFQLPYYLNFEMPSFALMVGSLIVAPPGPRAAKVAQWLQLVLGWVALLVVAAVLVFAQVPFGRLGVAVLALPAALFMVRGWAEGTRPWVFSAAVGAAVAMVMNGVFYPWFLTFEAGLRAAERLPTHEAHRVFSMVPSYAFDFYASPRIHWLSMDEAATSPLASGSYVYVTGSDASRLLAAQDFEVVERFQGIHISMPRLPFLNPATRSGAMQETLLLRSR